MPCTQSMFIIDNHFVVLHGIIIEYEESTKTDRHFFPPWHLFASLFVLSRIYIYIWQTVWLVLNLIIPFFSPLIIIKIRSIFSYAMKSYNSLFRLFSLSLYSPAIFGWFSAMCLISSNFTCQFGMMMFFVYKLVSSYWVLHIMWMDLNLSSPGRACSNTLSPYFPLSWHIFTQQLLNAFVRPHCIYIMIRQWNAIKKRKIGVRL